MSSASPNTKLFLFGGNGHIGQTIVSVLTSPSLPYHSHFTISVVIRPDTLSSKEEKNVASLTRLRSAGVHLIPGDLSKASVDEVSKWISGQDVVLSTISSYAPGDSPDLKIIEAVQLAKVQWFIPSFFGVDLTQAYLDPLPLLVAKKQVLQTLQKLNSESKVNSFYLMNGVFIEYLFSPFAGVDIANSTLTVPYSLDSQVTTTLVNDIGPLTAELLLNRENNSVKNQVVRIAGDTLSYKELHKLLEEKYKKEFKIIIEKKESAIQAVKDDEGKFQNIVGRFRVVFGEQNGVHWKKEEAWNFKYAKHIKVTNVKEYLEKLP